MFGPLRAAAPGRGLAGEIRVPGDGAIGLRALMLAAIAGMFLGGVVRTFFSDCFSFARRSVTFFFLSALTT